jgi:hypothetical protein
MSKPDLMLYLKKKDSVIKSQKIFYEKDFNSIVRVKEKIVYKKDSLEALVEKLN